MLTVGIDLAAEDTNTAAAVIRWTPTGARVQRLESRAGDGVLLELLAAADKAGVDCPLGWPAPFVEFVTAHHAGTLLPDDELVGKDWRRTLAWRRTDLVTRDETGLVPLSVSADRIGHAAMRCAALLARLAAAGRPVDRAGGGVVVEVYPAASLKRWGLPHRGYKGAANGPALGDLVDRLTAEAPWLRLGEFEDACRRSDHALDAVLSALTARAAATGRGTAPAPAHAALAGAEGWIYLPTTRLADLLG